MKNERKMQSPKTRAKMNFAHRPDTNTQGGAYEA